MNKYLQYDYLELADDVSFIKWVKNSPPIDNHNWKKWVENHPEKASEVERARQLVIGMKFRLDNPVEGKKEEIWSKISNDIKLDTKPIPKSNVRTMFWYGAAAAVLLFLFVVNMGSGYDTNIETPYASIQEVTLPDGSLVTVNSDSKIKYNGKTWEESRELLLDGEAFFSVQKGSKFTVKTKLGNVQVLGTSFNVFARDDKLDVLCETGKVAVIVNLETLDLTPNQSMSLTDGKLIRNDDVTESSNRANWMKGIFSYNNVNLKEVVQEVERQLDVSIVIEEDLLNSKYTGSFNKSNLETALSEVFWPLELNYTIDGDQVLISK